MAVPVTHIFACRPGNEDYGDYSTDMELDASFFKLYLLSMPFRVRMRALQYYHTHQGTSAYLSMLSVGALQRNFILLPSIEHISVLLLMKMIIYEEARGDNKCRQQSQKSDEELLRTREQARKVDVRSVPFTWEFLECRSVQEGEPRDDEFQLKKWRDYQMRLAVRKSWDEVLRSRYEWDWDVAGCLHRMFQIRSPRRQVRVREGTHGELDVSVSLPQASLPKTIRVAVMSDTGEVTYKTYRECEPVYSASQDVTQEELDAPVDGGKPISGKFRVTCEDADDEDD